MIRLHRFIRSIFYTLPFFLLGEGLADAQRLDSLADERDQLIENAPEQAGGHLWFGISYVPGVVYSDNIYGAREVLATCGGFTQRTFWAQYFASYTRMPIRRTSLPSFPIKNGVSVFLAGLEVRSDPPEEYPSVDTYVSLGAGFGYVCWNYSAPMGLALPANSYEFTFCGDFHIGLGVILHQSGALLSGIDIIPGATVFPLKTVHDYPNTIFSPIPYIKVRLSFNVAVSEWQWVDR